MEEFKLFASENLFLYLLGFLTFLTTILNDWLNPKKKFKKFIWYILEFIYTLIAIVLGIACCYALKLNNSVSLLITIVMGLIGSSLVRRLINQKNIIANELVKSATKRAKDTIEGKNDKNANDDNKDEKENFETAEVTKQKSTDKNNQNNQNNIENPNEISD